MNHGLKNTVLEKQERLDGKKGYSAREVVSLYTVLRVCETKLLSLQKFGFLARVGDEEAIV